MNPPEVQQWLDRLTERARVLGDARMLRDDQDLTPDLKTAVINRFVEFVKSKPGRSASKAAASMDIAGSTLSQVLAGTYAADDENIIRKIDKWLEAQISKESAPRPAGFVRTSVATRIIGLAKLVYDSDTIGLVYGDSGVGKTMTALAIRADMPGSIYIRITTAGQSKVAVLSMLASALTLPGMKLMTSHQLQEQIVAALKDKGRLIIVDEVHKLVEKRKDEALHTLRDIHDATGCPMLWFGMANLAEYIRSGRNRYEPLEQLYGRIEHWLDLRQITAQEDGGPGLHTIDDIRKMLAKQQIRVTTDAETYLTDLANEPGQGGLRAAYNLARTAAQFAKGKPITADFLRDLRRQKLGAKYAQQVENSMEMRRSAAG